MSKAVRCAHAEVLVASVWAAVPRTGPACAIEDALNTQIAAVTEIRLSLCRICLLCTESSSAFTSP